MRAYKNDFTRDEDFALWQLHETRSKIAAQNSFCDETNKSADSIIKKYNLKKIKISRRPTASRRPAEKPAAKEATRQPLLAYLDSLGTKHRNKSSKKNIDREIATERKSWG